MGDYNRLREAVQKYVALAGGTHLNTNQRTRYERLREIAKILEARLGESGSNPANLSLDEVIELLKQEGLTTGVSKETVASSIKTIGLEIGVQYTFLGGRIQIDWQKPCL